ncbi:hypothetical protein C8024_08585 [Sphingopyxis sp. BSNA05]|nr:hypothetical protein [Sphingopyxis sp. BSNA05]
MSKIALRIIACIGIFATAISGSQSSAKMPDRPEVQIPQGRLTGTIKDDIRIFKGIAYALPPVGHRRWQPPAPPAKWQGTFDANAFGASCIQPPYPASSVYFEELAATSEDCLTLNIWSPKTQMARPWSSGSTVARCNADQAPARCMTEVNMRREESFSFRSTIGSGSSAGWHTLGSVLNRRMAFPAIMACLTRLQR